MRTLCDVCEAAPARFFCAADEAALCSKCDEKVHGCNKLASRHIRVVLAESRTVPRCDICENTPAFFFCGIDGTSLCLQCDMDVHVGVKKTHHRYLLMGQRVELPIKVLDEEAGTHPLPDDENPHATHPQRQQAYQQNGMLQGRDDNSNASAIGMVVGDLGLPISADHQAFPTIDLNFQPHRHGESSYGSESVRDMEVANGSNFDAVRVAPSKGKELVDS